MPERRRSRGGTGARRHHEERPLGGFLGELHGSGGITAAVALVGDAHAVVAADVIGLAVADPATPATVDTRFDYASLTKPWTATLAIVLDRARVLPLATRIGDVFPRAHERLAPRRLGELLRHGAGLAAWAPLYARCKTSGEALELLLSGDLLTEEGEVYSDLGYILWGFAAEAAIGVALARLFEERLLKPLGARDVAPSPGPVADVAESRLSNEREAELASIGGVVVPVTAEARRGVPQDGNARFLGGLAGHAGLFGTAGALWKLGSEWLEPRAVLDRTCVEAALEGGDRFALGWWRPKGHQNAGPAVSARSFGMVGFTGGGLWIDPRGSERGGHGSIAVLAAHRTSSSFDMAPWRRRFHRLAADVLATARSAVAV